MKTKQTVLCGNINRAQRASHQRCAVPLLLLAVIFALTFITCDDGGDGGTDTPVTFSSAAANGSSSQTTTQLTLTFSAAITNLTAADITLSGVSGVSKGTLSGSGPTYTLPISGFTTGGTLSVAAAKTGYAVSGSPKQVTIYYYNSGSGAWIDPATQTTQLTGGTVLLSYSQYARPLTGSPYHYTTWDYSEGVGSTNKFTWYGANQGGGGAFKAEWSAYFLARLGYYWGNGGLYTQYKNIYIDYNFNRTNNTSSYGGYIGMYGWSRNSSAAAAAEKLIEYYIIDDWFQDEQLRYSDIKSDSALIGEATEHGSFVVDGATYKIYSKVRNDANIDGDAKPFLQLLSVRQGRRTYGTISVTEHFKAWSKYITLGNLYEVTFKVEAFGGNGNIDLTYLYLSQEETRRNIPAGTTPVDAGGGEEPGEIVVGSFSAYAGNQHIELSSSVAYQVVNLTGEGRTNVMKVTNPDEWAVVLYDLAAYKNTSVTITFSADVKRAGAEGTLNWQVNNDDYPSVGTPISNAPAGIWHTMSGTWTGTPTAEYPSFYLSTYQNNSDSTTYYIDNFTITVE